MLFVDFTGFLDLVMEILQRTDEHVHDMALKTLAELFKEPDGLRHLDVR